MNKRDLAYFTDHKTEHPMEHQTLFRFTNDSGNYAFIEWWTSRGKRDFIDCCREHLDALNENERKAQD